MESHEERTGHEKKNKTLPNLEKERVDCGNQNKPKSKVLINNKKNSNGRERRVIGIGKKNLKYLSRLKSIKESKTKEKCKGLVNKNKKNS